LIANAHQHFTNVFPGGFNVTKSFRAFITSLIVSIRALWIEITPVAGGGSKSFQGFGERIVGSSVFITERGFASAVEMESGDGGHCGEVAEGSEGAEGAEGLAVEDVVEIALSLPLVVKDAIGSGLKLEFSDAFPAVSFPLAGTISTEILLNAITTVLSLAVSFEAGFVGGIVFHGSERKGLTVGFNADHALAIKGAPGAFACSASNAEVTATDDAGLLDGSASAFDLAGVAGIELEATNGTISFDELHAHNAGASVEDEPLDEGGFVHERRHLCPTTPEQYNKKAP